MDDFLEGAYEERYEEPDYNVWETNRVYEDIALEREEAEAEALAEEAAADAAALYGIVLGAVEHREYDEVTPIWGDVVKEVVDALVAVGIKAPTVEATHEAHAARGENHWITCPLCDDEDPEG